MSTLNFDVFWRDRGAARGLQNLSKEADKTHSSFEKVTKTTSGFGSLTSLAFKAAGAAAVGYGLKVASGNEQARISFTTMLGSAQKADVFLKQLQQFAATTPFEFPELQTAASSLISAGINANKVIPIMRTLGDVTSGMGTGSEGIKRATVALQQMNAAGKITAEDLNQLRDAGIPVYDLLAAATHKSKEEVAGLAAQGKLGRKELEQLMTALESGKGLERFNGLMEQQSKSLAGMVSTLKDVSGQMLAGWLEPLFPALKASIGAFADMGSNARNTIGIIAGGTAVLAVAASGAAKLAGSFTTLGLSASSARIAVGGFSAVLGIATLAFGLYASEHAKAKARTEEFTQALQGEEDAVRKASAAVAAKQLQDLGALDASDQLGLSMDDVIAAALGQEGALARIQPLLDSYVEAGVDGSIADQDRATAAGDLSDALKTVSGAHSDATSQSKQLAEATAAGEAAMGGMEKKTKTATQSLQQWRAEMFKSAHAALDLAGSQDAVEAAVDDATQSVKDNGRTLNNNTEKGRENRQALRNLAGASLAYREKLIEQHKSTKQVTEATKDGREEFIKVARRMGLTRDEARKLADKYGLVEDKTSKVAKATRQYDRDINNLNSKRISLVADYRATATAAAVQFFKTVPGSQASGFSQLPRRAEGGFVNGKGGPTSDSILARLSNGEFVVRASQARKHAPTLEAINTPGFAHGGEVNVRTPGLSRARSLAGMFDNVATTAASSVFGAGLRAIGKTGQAALDAIRAAMTVGGSGGGWGPILALARSLGMRQASTYAGHHPSAALARDMFPPSQRLASGLWAAARRLGIWYVIFNRRIASMTRPGAGWAPYTRSNPHTDHVHVSIYPSTLSRGGGFTRAGGGSNRAIGHRMMLQRWPESQWPPLNSLWTKESGWRTTARNPSSGAYGIPQALPAGKMRSAGADYLSNPATQIAWGLGYIASRYGTPGSAWRHSQRTNWYDMGGILPPGGIGVNGTRYPERVLSPAQTKAYDRNGGGNTYIINAPNYVGDKNDLVKALTDLDRQGRLAVVRR